MGTIIDADEGRAVALEPVEIEYVRRLLGGLADVRDGTVTFSRVVGHLRLPTRRFVRIRSPKAPLASVLAWAAYADPLLEALRLLATRVPAFADEGDLGTMLARLYVTLLEEAILRHGLLRQYRRSRTESAMVRGRIDFARLARQGASLDRVPCEVWERGEGTALNRFLVAALVVCARDETVRSACEPHLSRVSARTAAIEPGIDPALLRGARVLDRAEQPFAAVVALARWLLLGHGLADGADRAGSGFLVNLEALFEATVARALRDSGIDAVPKQPLAYGRWTGEQVAAGSAFEIDVLCRGLACGTLIVDAKYKRQISSANLQQMIAYCTMTGATRAAFVVPAGLVGDRRPYVFRAAGDTTVRVDVLELATDAVDVTGWRKSAHALADEVAAL